MIVNSAKKDTNCGTINKTMQKEVGLEHLSWGRHQRPRQHIEMSRNAISSVPSLPVGLGRSYGDVTLCEEERFLRPLPGSLDWL